MTCAFGRAAFCRVGAAVDLTVKADLKGMNMVREHDFNDPFTNRCGGKHGDMNAGWTFVSAIEPEYRPDEPLVA